MLSYPRYPWAHAIKHNMETFQACQDSSRTGKKNPHLLGAMKQKDAHFRLLHCGSWSEVIQPTDPKCAHMNALRSVYLKYNEPKNASARLLYC